LLNIGVAAGAALNCARLGKDRFRFNVIASNAGASSLERRFNVFKRALKPSQDCSRR
jgi:hypothetical protein